jgi:hypothetical protein
MAWRGAGLESDFLNPHRQFARTPGLMVRSPEQPWRIYAIAGKRVEELKALLADG